MKRRSTAILLSFAAVLAVSAAVSSAAYGEESSSWFVNGTKLASGATVALASTTKMDESAIFNDPSIKVDFTCTGGTDKELIGEKSYIKGPDVLGAESLIFEGCSEIEPSSCTMSTSIATEPIVSSLEAGSGSLDRIRFAPKAGKAFLTVDFTGSCVLAGEQPIDGSVTQDLPSGKTEAAPQTFAALGTTENNSLEIAKDKAYLERGRWLLKLASGLAWSFH